MTVVEAEVTERPAGAAPRSHRSTGTWFGKYGLCVLFAAVVVLFSTLPSTSDVFTSRANIENLLADQTVVTLMALALMAPLIAGAFDFSVGSVTGVASVATAAAMTRFDLPFVAAILVALGIGAAIGLVNALAVTKLGLNPFIITLAVATILGGAVQWYTGGLAITALQSSTFLSLGSGDVLGVPTPAVLLVIVAVVCWYLLEHTPIGRHLRAVGANREASRLIGIDVNRTVTTAFVASGVLAALAGVLLASRNGGSNPGDGQGLLFGAIAAAFLGSTAIRPGQFNVGGTVLGVLFVAVSVSGLNIAGVDPWVQPVFNGTALAVSVTIASLGSRHARQP